MGRKGWLGAGDRYGVGCSGGSIRARFDERGALGKLVYHGTDECVACSSRVHGIHADRGNPCGRVHGPISVGSDGSLISEGDDDVCRPSFLKG